MSSYIFNLLSSLLAPVQGRRDRKQGKKKEYKYLKREKDDVNRGREGEREERGEGFQNELERWVNVENE